MTQLKKNWNFFPIPLISLLLLPFFGTTQFTTTPINQSVYAANSLVNIDIDGDLADDMFFTLGFFFNTYNMKATSLSPDVKISSIASIGNPFLNYDSNKNLANASYLCWGWYNSDYADNTIFNNTRYIGYYKKISPTDSLFGYLTVELIAESVSGIGPNSSSCADSIHIITNHISTVPNTPPYTGQICEFEFNINPDYTCTSAGEGKIQTTVIGGVYPFTYNWSNGSTGPTVNGLYQGDYTVIITDATGCIWYDTIYVDTFSLAVNYSISGSPSPGCNTNVEVTPLNTPFSHLNNYSWSTGDDSTYIDSLCPGWYFVEVTNSLGCIYTDSILISVDSILTTGYFNLLPTSCGSQACDASVTIYAEGGIPPYSLNFPWGMQTPSTDSINSFDVNYLCAGWHTYTITDSLGDSIENSIYVPSSQSDLTFINLTNQPASCCSCSDGGFEYYGFGGTAPYMYSLNGGAPQVNSDFYGLAPGQYEFCITDVNGCNGCWDIYVGTYFGGYPTIIEPLCNQCNGSIQLNMTSYTGTLFYNWSTSDTSSTIGGLCAGSYDVTVTDTSGTGCPLFFQFEIGSPDFELLPSYVGTSSCFGSCESQVDISTFVQAGTPGYIFSVDSIQYSNWITGLCPGTYQLIGLDANFCKDTSVLEIIEAPQMLLDSINGINPTCFSNCDGQVNYTINNGNQPYSYISSNGSVTSTALNQFEINGLCADSLIIQVTDNNGCIQTDTLFISSPDSLYFSYNQLSIATCTNCNDGSIQLSVQGGVSPYSYDWSAFSSPVTGNQANDLLGGTQLVCVTDNNGCIFCDSVTVVFIDDVGFELSHIDFFVRPNPISETAIINAGTKIDQIELHDLQGKLIFKELISSTKLTTIDVSQISNGMYWMTIYSETEGKFGQQKIVVQH